MVSNNEGKKSKIIHIPDNIHQRIQDLENLKNYYKNKNELEKALKCLSKLYHHTENDKYLKEIKDINIVNYFSMLDKFKEII